MKVVKPVSITPAMVLQNTALEPIAAYSSVVSYALDAQCVVGGTRVYRCIQGPALDKAPSTSPAYWVDEGPSNRWAMFDGAISTQTSAQESLTLVLKPGIVNSVCLFGLEGARLLVELRDGPGGPLLYTCSKSLDGTIIADWYQYFFEPSVQLAEVVLTDLPPYGNAHITVTITGGGTVKCGAVLVGTLYYLGGTQYGATAGITDYSKKDTDANGVTTLIKRAYSKRISVPFVLKNAQLNKVQSILADLRATPCAWIGTDVPGFEPLTVFGFYREFNNVVQYAKTSYCTLEIEGLI